MICKNCGEPIQKDIELMGSIRRVPILCTCKKEEMENKKNIEEAKEKQYRLQRLINNSLMDKKFTKETFENWDFNKGQKNMYDLGLKYCEHFKECKADGLGLLLYGTPGNGKTYLSNCIANKLLSKFIPVICVGINSLLSRFKETYCNYGKEAEEGIIRALSNADLLVLDDLGSEQDTEWSRSRIYNIIDSRYRNGLPIIISTNKTINELKNMYHERTIDRLLEMCTPIENKKPSIRQENSKVKTDKLKEILYKGV